MAKRKVYLYGHLAEKYGNCFELAVKSVGEAVRALEANFRGFRQDIREGKYQVCRGPIAAFEEADLAHTTQLSEQEVSMKFGEGDFHIRPILDAAGNKGKGWVQIIVGAVLFVAGYFTFGTTSSYGLMLMGMGLSLAFNGVGTLLAPSPEGLDGEQDRPEENKSFLFNGVINTMAEGGAVPINYGKFICGSTVISSAYQAEEL